MWVYFLHVCMSIKMHCLLNTGLLPTCRNMHTHTHTHTRTHTHTHRHNPASQAVVPNLHVHFIEMTGASAWVPTSQGGMLGPAADTRLPSPRGQHMDRPTQDLAPATHSSSFQPPSETEPAALRWLGGGENERVVKPRNTQQRSRHLAVPLQMHLVSYDLLKNGVRASAERHSK